MGQDFCDNIDRPFQVEGRCIHSLQKFIHILNGTAFAIGRTIIAILENYQQENGSVLIPKILQKYLNKEKITPKNI